MNNYIPAGSSPGLIRAPGQPLVGTYIGCSVIQNVPARPTFSVYRCNRRRCATCAVIQPLRFFQRSLTHRQYTVISACDLSCFTTNVIYLISCAKCERKVSKRLSGHRSSIKNTQTLSSPGISIYPDILWMTSEYNLLSISHRALERPSRMLQLDRERFWMLELGTVSLRTQWSLATRWKRFTFLCSIQEQCV